ncbi:hypothetical protein M427DRAFT_59678 [Gonapodya prolifera JEL478]|uniref:S-adenosyl-L-methionine-dependent methyltransferase n=1 Tax=Gonapodya prolifera (strain JEL478) TaxID=1344416 RepID=A0A139A6C2_GONPJ|nr:hypothetical protein M427DRAFT_59678 [Gonapodya prolifera JEL478]|eukprot:KXS12352.1 hypothetical protein M427DRAFT_59678 [Gonapodya prolifera JEL478]
METSTTQRIPGTSLTIELYEDLEGRLFRPPNGTSDHDQTKLEARIAGKVWEAAPALACLNHINHSENSFSSYTVHDHEPFRILELGAGTGYLGLAIAKLLEDLQNSNTLGTAPLRDVEVVLTDLDAAIPLLQRNFETNFPSATFAVVNIPSNGKLTVRAASLAWSSAIPTWCSSVRWDLVVGSDLVYWPRLHGPLKDTVLSNSSMITNASSAEVPPPILLASKLLSATKEDGFFDGLGNGYREREITLLEARWKGPQVTEKQFDETVEGWRIMQIEL